MHDGSATAPGTGEGSHETGESEDNDSLSLRIRLPDGKVSIENIIANARILYFIK